MIKILAIQPIGPILHAILSNGKTLPVSSIVGSPSPGKMLKEIEGLWTVVTGVELCET